MITRSQKPLSRVALMVAVLAMLVMAPSTAVAEERETVSGYYDLGKFGVTVSYPKQANPGDTVDIAVELRTDRDLDFIVRVDLYCPGAGWNGWVEYFKGHLTARSAVHRSNSFLIPSRAKTGYAVIWVAVFFTSSRDYQRINGKDYYAEHSWVIAGPYIVSPEESVFEELLAALLINYTLLEADYNALKSDYDTLKKRFSELEESYNTLKESYGALQREHGDLKSRYEDLKGRYEALSAEHESLKSELAAKTSTVNALTAATIALAVMLAASVAALVLKVRRPAPEGAGLPSAQASTRSTVAPPP